MSGQIRSFFTTIVVALLLVSVATPAFAARSGGSRARETRAAGDDENAAPEKDERKRTVGGGYAVEAELETDRSIETWMYVFSALMLLCIGWLCFKPTRLRGKKSAKTLLPKKAGPANNKGAGAGKKPKPKR